MSCPWILRARALLLGVTAASACGDSSADTRASDRSTGQAPSSSSASSDTTGPPWTTSAGPQTSEETGSSGDTTTGGMTRGASSGGTTEGVDTDELCAPDQLACASECCAAHQVCYLDACADDCGGAPPCGPARVCCAAQEVCYLDACVVPGAACDETVCATKEHDPQCDEGDVCDAQLGVCVPSGADASCLYVPPQNVFEPRPLFTWGARAQLDCDNDSQCQNAESCDNGVCAVTWPHVTPGPDDAPSHTQSSSIPLVVDIDDNCVPDIIFNTFSAGEALSDGVLRAIRGDTGAKIWSVTDPAYRTNGTANPAAGDIDGDGRPEVVVQGEGSYLVAVDDDGAPLWKSPSFAGASKSGSTAIANMDGEGLPEILFGAAVFDAAGALLWEGALGVGFEAWGPISCVADLDGDGRPELVGGRTAYTFTGTVEGGDFAGATLWHSIVGDGRCGVADFDQDGAPEVILVHGGQIHALDGATGDPIASYDIPGTQDRGGAPNIADFDGDGVPEVATAGAAYYVVVRFDGESFTELWRAPVEDDSSRVTGSSVFDFDGDGRNEVVYNDENYIRIYPGVEPDCELNPPGPACDGVMSDDEVLFFDRNSSRTHTEYPVVADVDGDLKAELVFPTNNDINWGIDAGVEVLQDGLDNWVNTRPVWNQHTYHITNVTDLGAIPPVEEDSWGWPLGDPHNSYRRNTQGVGDFCAPDLVLHDLKAAPAACPALDISARVANKGCLGVGPGVRVSIFEQTLGFLGTTQTVGFIPAGGSEEVHLFHDADIMDGVVTAIVDADEQGDGLLNECIEDNNSAEAPVCPGVG